MDELEKSKRKAKPKGGYRPRNLALTLIGVCAILLVGAYMLMKVTIICGCENPTYATASAIMETNAQVAVLLTQTSDAATAAAFMTGSPQPPEYQTQIAQTKTALASTSLSVTATPTICAFFWAHDDSPKDLAAIQAAFDTAGITGATVSVDAYGEATTCGGFGLMDITPTITIPAVVNETPAESGARIEQILKAIQGAGTSTLNKVIIIFQSTGTESVRWSLDWAKALDALNTAMTGAALYETGRGQD